MQSSSPQKSASCHSTLGARQLARQELWLEVLRSWGEARLGVKGASMLPAIWPGDELTLRSCEATELRPGDVVSFWRGEFLVSHRVESILANGMLLTRGDSARQCDAPVSSADVLGRVVAIERNGRCVSPAQSPWQRIASRIFRRSALCTRVLLFAYRRLTAPRLRQRSARLKPCPETNRESCITV